MLFSTKDKWAVINNQAKCTPGRILWNSGALPCFRPQRPCQTSHYLWFQQKHQKQPDFNRSTPGSQETEQGMEGHRGATTKDLLPSVITLCPGKWSRDAPSSRPYLFLWWITGSWELHLGHRTCQLSVPLLSYISRPLFSFTKILDLG